MGNVGRAGVASEKLTAKTCPLDHNFPLGLMMACGVAVAERECPVIAVRVQSVRQAGRAGGRPSLAALLSAPRRPEELTVTDTP